LRELFLNPENSRVTTTAELGDPRDIQACYDYESMWMNEYEYDYEYVL